MVTTDRTDSVSETKQRQHFFYQFILSAHQTHKKKHQYNNVMKIMKKS